MLDRTRRVGNPKFLPDVAVDGLSTGVTKLDMYVTDVSLDQVVLVGN